MAASSSPAQEGFFSKLREINFGLFYNDAVWTWKFLGEIAEPSLIKSLNKASTIKAYVCDFMHSRIINGPRKFLLNFTGSDL